MKVNLVSPVYEAPALRTGRAPRLSSLAGVREFVRVRKGSATRPAEPEHVARLLKEVDAVVITLTEDELHTQAEQALAEIVSVLTRRP